MTALSPPQQLALHMVVATWSLGSQPLGGFGMAHISLQQPTGYSGGMASFRVGYVPKIGSMAVGCLQSDDCLDHRQ